MALTKTEVRNSGFNAGQLQGRMVDVALGAYATGGIALGASLFNLQKLLGAIPVGGNAAAKAYRYHFDTVNKKLLAFKTGGDITVYTHGDIKGSANTDQASTDQAAGPTNGYLLLAADTFTNLAGTMTPTVQPDIPRNICIVVENTTGGALNLYEGVTTYAVTGTFRGAAQTESITHTSTAGNKSVAAAKFRYIYGSKPFDSVTSITITNAPAGGLSGGVGIGSKLGLPTTPINNVEADIIKLYKNAADLAVSGTFSNNQTINFGALSNGDDIAVEYTAAGEVVNGISLSAITVRLLGLGY